MPPHTQDQKLWEAKFGNSTTGHISHNVSLDLLNCNPPHIADIKNIPTTMIKVSEVPTSHNPKHICTVGNFIYVSCMGDKCVEIYEYVNGAVHLKNKIKLDYPCIHSIVNKNFLYTTLSDFNTDEAKNDRMAVTNISSGNSTYIDTHGKWSKFAFKHPIYPILLVSNWFSNDISIFNIEDPHSPKFLTSIRCGVSPRGMAYSQKGNVILVACYYSRNIVEISLSNNLYHVSHIGAPFDYPNYSGNMRDIVTDQQSKFAFVSNMGRNIVHKYDIRKKTIVKSVLVGEHPNSLYLSKSYLYVNCFKTPCIFQLSKDGLKIVGKSETSYHGLVGLSMLDEKLLVTSSYDKNMLEFWQLINQRI